MTGSLEVLRLPQIVRDILKMRKRSNNFLWVKEIEQKQLWIKFCLGPKETFVVSKGMYDSDENMDILGPRCAKLVAI